MLLNQCLAISLSPLAAVASSAAVGGSRCKLDNNVESSKQFAVARLRVDLHATQSQRVEFKSEAREIGDDHTFSAIFDNDRNEHPPASCNQQQQEKEEEENHQELFKLKHSSALLLFTQLVEQNSKPISFADINKADQSSQASSQEQQKRRHRRESSGNSSSASNYGYSLTRATSLRRPSLPPPTTAAAEAPVSLAERQSFFKELGEALGRVEFAGFVMPSWLLVSGSYDDLHCIKSSWADAKLKSPTGFKIETIGNIRSINVDYFGSTATEMNKEFAQVRSSNDHNNNNPNYKARRIEKSVKQPQQARLSRLPYRLSLDQRELRDRQLPKFGSTLNAAIVDSVRELSKQNDSNSRQTATTSVAGIHVTDLLDHLSSKYSSQLLNLPATEFIDCAISGLVKSSKLCLRPATRASRQRRRRQQQQRATLEQAKRQHNNQDYDRNGDNFCQSSNRFDVIQSAFLDQLILPGDEEDDNTSNTSNNCNNSNRNNDDDDDDDENNDNDCTATAAEDSDCDEQSFSGAELLMSQQHQRRVSRISSSASTTKSKSTTLDSGIQSWDLASASPTATEIETSNNSQSSSSHNSSPSSLGPIEVAKSRQQRQSQRHDSPRLLFLKQQQREEADAARKGGCRQEIIMMAAPTTPGSLHHRDHDGQVAAQSAAAFARKAAPAAASGQAPATTSKYFDSQPEDSGDQQKRTRRGFSLSRSFSFRAKKSATVMNENDNNKETEKEENQQQQHYQAGRWSAKEEQARRAANSDLLAAVGRQALEATEGRPIPKSNKLVDTTNCDLYASRGKISNLSSLFRSKSMRIISSGKGQQRQASFFNRLTPSTNTRSRFDTTNEDYENFAPNINAFEDANGSHSNQWTSQQQHRSGNHNNQHQQATIDYLATAQPHKRSFSTRRLTFSSAKEDELHHSSSGANGGGGKIVLFLRKLFNLRKTRLLDAQDATTTTNSTLHLMSTHNRYDNHHQQRDQSPLDEASGRGGNGSASRLTRDLRTRISRPLGAKHAFSASSSSSSSGSNSLIEILDCSRAVDSTKRLLREESALGLNRATWRLVRRSDSSLSRNSRASCETIKSTVSQQLRRHLDEAYRRHRKCTSQREKEFIDSINVLRQASRHALQNSRSSSKVRQAKSAKSSSNNGSASDDTASSVGSTCASANCSTLANRERNISSNNNNMNITATADSRQLCANCSCNQRLHANQQSIGAAGRGQEKSVEAGSGSSNGQAAIARDFDLIPRQEQQQQQAMTALDDANLHDHQHEHQHQPQWLSPAPSGCEHSSSFASNCCPICTSYLTSARLCPTLAGCCPPPPPPAVGVPACCLAGGQHAGQPARIPLLPGAGDQEAAAVEAAAAFCCPIWRSMVYNYCPPGFPSVACQPSVGLPHHQQQQQPLIDQQQMQPFGSQALENYSTSSSSSMHQHQVQQHQHNTTIDLKIEIGADLLKQAAANNNKTTTTTTTSINKQTTRERRVGSLAAQTTSGGSGRPVLVEPPLSDSLDSNGDEGDDDFDVGDGYEADDYDGDDGDAEQTEESLEANVAVVEAVSVNSAAATTTWNANNNKITIREFELDSCDSSDQSKLDSLRTANQVKLG